ncbi:hypothetical protein B5S32_g3334 [[Candida] boidinii]|nr:hypothetical protein B5S32_g3334 [[Candida] boidinii]
MVTESMYGAIEEEESERQLQSSISSSESLPNLLKEGMPDDLKDIPQTVIDTLELDPRYSSGPEYADGKHHDVPCITFRYFILSILFVIPGAFMDTANSYRTTSAPYSILFVQFLAYPFGKWLAKVLPKKKINIFGLFSFDLNPGPWSIKESVMVTLTAASGATGNQGTVGLSLAEVYYGEKISPFVAIPFMWAIVWTGYSFGAIARNFVLYDPQFIWPQALMQTSLFRAQFKSDINVDDNVEIGNENEPVSEERGANIDINNNNSQLRIFMLGVMFMFLWEFLPEFLFPMTSSLALLCWASPYNKALNFIGSGLGGMGFMNITLDWSNITSSVMLNPYWTIVLQFCGYVMSCWILLPIFKFSNDGKYSTGLMDNHLLTVDGHRYPTLELITSDLKFNETAYLHYGPVNLGAQRLWGIFFDYGAYCSAITWIVLFGYNDIKKSFNKLRSKVDLKEPSHLNGDQLEHETEPLLHVDEDDQSQHHISNLYRFYRGHKRVHDVSSQYHDRINQRNSIFEDIPNSWFFVLFLLSFATLSYIFINNYLFLSFQLYLVALVFGVVIVIPMSYLYALSNFQLPIGTVNELICGLLIQFNIFTNNNDGSKHPVSASIYGAIAGNTWYRCQYILQDQKIGMYNNISPKCIFFSQIFGDLIGVPFNYMALRWVIRTKKDYINGSKTDPLHQWTSQVLINYNTNAIQYVLLGPIRIFKRYPILPFGFIFGIVLPILIYFLYKLNLNLIKKNNSKFNFNFNFNFWNTTIIFSTMSKFYGNISTGPFTQFLIGTVTMFYMFRYKHELFKRYNYVIAAAFDTGFNLCMAILFIFVSGGLLNNGKAIQMPNWWGNDPNNIEKCYA